MASDKRTVEYLVEQLGGAGAIRSRAMFGEYGLYCDDIFVALICDDQLFVKSTPVANQFLSDENLAPPYPGAKDAYRVPEERWEDREWLAAFVGASAQVLAASAKPARPRKAKAE
jgi:TfoX/Sxy family transcriptional regulator of competence genes